MKSVADVPSPEDDDSEDPEFDLLYEHAGSSSAALPAMEAVEEEAEGELRGGKRNRKHSPDTGAAAPIDPISDLAVLEGSALVPFLESRLQNSSFLEICRHTAVFKVNLSTFVRSCSPLPMRAQYFSP